MNPLVLMLLAILPIAAFAIGVLLVRMNNSGNTITKAERSELQLKRDLVHAIDLKASEHMAYGDNFAIIASDMINNHRTELAQKFKEIS